MSDESNWRYSPGDRRVHDFRELGAVYAFALCATSALIDRLTEPSDGDRYCLSCRCLNGENLNALLNEWMESEWPVVSAAARK